MSDQLLKKDLVNAYKILSYLKLEDHTYTHLSIRSGCGGFFYIYPFGFCFNEVTQESLLKISFTGDVIEGSEYQFNQTGYVLHGSIYKARPDISVIFHFHTPEIVSVSACEDGLLPISQWALHFYNRISYDDYNSLNLDIYKTSQIIEDLKNKFTMLLRNHGSITCGRTVKEAMFYTHHLQKACETQCLALAMNQKLIMPSAEVCQQSSLDLLSFEKDLGDRDWQAWVRLLKKIFNAMTFSRRNQRYS